MKRLPVSVTQKEIADRLGLHPSVISKVLNNKFDPLIRPETREKVWRTAEEMGFHFTRLRYYHKRTSLRSSVSLKARILLLFPDGSLYDEGTTLVRELGLGGALLSNIVFPKMSYPSEPFWVTLLFEGGSMRGVRAKGRIIRFERGVGLDAVVVFDRLSRRAEEKIKRVIGQAASQARSSPG